MESEKFIELKLVKKINDLGGRAYKFVSPGNAGVPDRLIVMPNGKVYFVELKSPKGKLSQLQIAQIKFIRSLDHRVVVISSTQDMLEFISEIGAVQ